MAADRVDRETVESILADLADPESGRSVVQMQQVRNVSVQEKRVELTLELTSWSAALWEEVRDEARKLLGSRLPGSPEIRVEIVEHRRPAEKIGEIGITAKSVVAVGSGKGGVGKSTIAACLAYGLAGAGSKVGLMDADVYGPSIPHLLGVNQQPYLIHNRLQPIEKDGLRVMSMGFLIPAGEAVVWRGPMLHGAITQFLRDTEWGDLDYLIIDMPPGTGDIALTLSQLLPLSGAVVVCTPQDLALLDAVKAIAMFRKVNIPVLGMVENMSYFLCPDNNKRYDIFGSGGARRKAEQLDVPFLGDVPINMLIRERGDAGETGDNLRDAATAPFLREICHGLVSELSTRHKARPPMPSLTVL